MSLRTLISARPSKKTAQKALRSTAKRSSLRRKKKRNLRNRRSRQGKSLPDRIEQAAPSIWEGLGAGVPGIWKGIRTLFGFKTLSPQTLVGAVPAAYQTVLTNQSFDLPEMPVKHPTLGLQGVAFCGSQYLFQTQFPEGTDLSPGGNLVVTSSFPGAILQQAGSTGVNLSSILLPVNPWNLGGQLAFRSFQYQRYRYNWFRLRFISTAGVTINGSLCCGYYKDADRGLLDFSNFLSFSQVADLVPSVVFPQNIASAEMLVPYNGNELYYMGVDQGRPQQIQSIVSDQWGDAQNRQEQQGVIALICDSLLPASTTAYPTMNVYFDYEIELYDPRPADDVIPKTLDERDAVRRALRYMRGDLRPDRALFVKTTRDRPSHVKALETFLDTKVQRRQEPPSSADPNPRKGSLSSQEFSLC